MSDAVKDKLEAIKGFCQMISEEDDPFLRRVQVTALWDLATQVKTSVELEYRKSILQPPDKLNTT